MCWHIFLHHLLPAQRLLGLLVLVRQVEGLKLVLAATVNISIVERAE